jgi:hypothetical protein
MADKEIKDVMEFCLDYHSAENSDRPKVWLKGTEKEDIEGILKSKLSKLRKLRNIQTLFVVNALLSEDLPEEPTEYDVLMKQKLEEFTSELLQKEEPAQVKADLKMCKEYIHGEPFAGFGLIVWYDMWLNESPGWPVMHNPKWEEWEKLKAKKVKKTE